MDNDGYVIRSLQRAGSELTLAAADVHLTAASPVVTASEVSSGVVIGVVAADEPRQRIAAAAGTVMRGDDDSASQSQPPVYGEVVMDDSSQDRLDHSRGIVPVD